MSSLFRRLTRLLTRLLVLLVVLPFLALTRAAKYVYISELISAIPFRFGEQVRYEFYRRTLAACGEGVTINFGTVLSYPDITVGSHVWLGTYNLIGHADIGDHVLTAQGCHIISGTHPHPFDRTDVPIMEQQAKGARVGLGPDVWLGAGAIVMANIGRGCVVGAGSVVTRDIPDWAVAAGNPARVLRYRKGQDAET
jgi:virginiamycin A acetyltransferase